MASVIDKLRKMWNPPEDEYDDYDYDEEAYEDEEEYPTQPQEDYQEPQQNTPSLFRRSSKVVNMNSAAAGSKSQLQVVVFSPMNFSDDVNAIANSLLGKNAVVLNMERTPREDALRLFVFLSGVTYAINGKIKRVATDTYIITPYNVDVTGSELFNEMEQNDVFF